MSEPAIDHTTDTSGQELYRLTRLHPAPEYVKQADFKKIHGDENMGNHLYADRAENRYPCHTKAATWMSALFFGHHKDQIPDSQRDLVSHRIEKSASYWEIANDVKTLWAEIEKAAGDIDAQTPDEDFLFVYNDTEGNKQRLYPLRNAIETVKASGWFGEHRDHFRFEDKHNIANKLLKKASQYDVELKYPELVAKCAGHGFCAAEDASKAWEARAAVVKDTHPDYHEVMLKLASTIKSQNFNVLDSSQRIKMAKTMDEFDRMVGISKNYEGFGLESPEDTLMGITTKEASEIIDGSITSPSGKIYQKSALASLDIGTVREWLGDDIAEASGDIYLDLEKFASVVATLPRPDAHTFDQMVESVGISPVLSDKAAEAVNSPVSDDLREAAAQVYQQRSAATPIA